MTHHHQWRWRKTKTPLTVKTGRTWSFNNLCDPAVHNPLKSSFLKLPNWLNGGKWPGLFQRYVNNVEISSWGIVWRWICYLVVLWTLLIIKIITEDHFVQTTLMSGSVWRVSSFDHIHGVPSRNGQVSFSDFSIMLKYLLEELRGDEPAERLCYELYFSSKSWLMIIFFRLSSLFAHVRHNRFFAIFTGFFFFNNRH